VNKSGALAAARRFLFQVFPGAIRPLRTLWHEVIGFLFLALAAWAIPSGIRTVREFEGGFGGLARIALVALFVLIMAGFGVTSFLRARKISRS